MSVSVGRGVFFPFCVFFPLNYSPFDPAATARQFSILSSVIKGATLLLAYLRSVAAISAQFAQLAIATSPFSGKLQLTHLHFVDGLA